MHIIGLSNIRRIAEEIGFTGTVSYDNHEQIMKILEEACLREGVIQNDVGEEVLLKTFALQVGDSVYKRNSLQKDKWRRIQKTIEKRTQERKNVNNHYINSFHESINSIAPKLSIQEAGVLFEMVLHMNLNGDGYLVQDGEYLILEDLMAYTGIGKTALIRYLKKFKQLGIVSWKRERLTRTAQKSDKAKKIRKGDTLVYSGNVYKINRHFHWMGYFDEQQMNMNFTKVYKVKAKELTERLTLEAKGLLYIILTKIHYQTYYLCLNPDVDLREDKGETLEWNIKQETMKEVDHLTRQGLLQLMNKSQSAVKRYIKELEDNSIIATFGRGSKEKYMVNPAIFWRTDDEGEFTYKDAVQYQFKQLKEKPKK